MLHTLRAHQDKFIRQYHVQSPSLFGSVARDEADADSNVDLLVECSQPIGLFRFIEFRQHLEALPGGRVDLGTLRSLKPRVKDHVLQESIRIV